MAIFVRFVTNTGRWVKDTLFTEAIGVPCLVALLYFMSVFIVHQRSHLARRLFYPKIFTEGVRIPCVVCGFFLVSIVLVIQIITPTVPVHVITLLILPIP